MIKFENIEIGGLKAAIRGMRNPFESWDKIDSYPYCPQHGDDSGTHLFHLGPNDKELALKLAKAGSDHRKYLRQIVVWVDVTAPLYWWKEADTYRHGWEKNSCSTMHCIHKKPFELSDFSVEQLILDDASIYTRGIQIKYHQCIDDLNPIDVINITIDALNIYRTRYLETKDKEHWWQMIQLLPSSYNQKRTCMISYEALRNAYHARKNHKLDEWRIGFTQFVKSLPNSELITEV